MFDATNAICEADTATGWLHCFAVTNPRSASGYPLEVLAKLYGDNRYFTLTSAVAPVGKAVRVEGGLRVSGHFAWCTTIQMSEWLSVVGMLDTPEGPRDWSFLMPSSSCKILDTWNATGLIATGTHQILVEDVFVPEGMATASSVVSPGWHANARKNFSHYPFYIAPVGPGLALTIAIAVVGMGRSVIEHSTNRLTHHIKRSSATLDSDKAPMQIRLAQAESMVHAAELTVRDAARDIIGMSCLSPEEQLTGFHRPVGRLAASAQMCREAAHLLAQSFGTSMYYEESPLGRAYRDLQVGSSHVALDLDTLLESSGRTMLGLPPLERPKPGESPRDEYQATSKDPFGNYNNSVE
jgi:alkylation response protein AidB-like acyl-CoA dehydrogenase